MSPIPSRAPAQAALDSDEGAVQGQVHCCVSCCGRAGHRVALSLMTGPVSLPDSQHTRNRSPPWALGEGGTNRRGLVSAHRWAVGSSVALRRKRKADNSEHIIERPGGKRRAHSRGGNGQRATMAPVTERGPGKGASRSDTSPLPGAAVGRGGKDASGAREHAAWRGTARQEPQFWKD